VIMGAGFLPFGLLIVTNFRGEYAQFVARLKNKNPSQSTERAALSPNGLRYGFGCLVVVVGTVFLVTGLVGGPGVTKPGGLF